MEDVNFDRMELSYSAFGTATIEQVSLRDANFTYCFVRECDVNYCDFSNANMTGSKIGVLFYCCRFDGASLTDVDISNSGFEYCTFKNANLSGTKICKEQLAAISLTTEQMKQIILLEEPADIHEDEDDDLDED